MKEPEHGSSGADHPSTVAAGAPGEKSPILVAIDFSSDSENALVWALEHARLLNAPVEILHVVHDPARTPGTYRPENGDPLEPMADVAERKLAAFLGEIGERHPGVLAADGIKSFCKAGLPVDTILRTAADRGASLLVVGCHGHNGAARLLFGSTSQSLAQKAEVPVTIVKASPQ